MATFNDLMQKYVNTDYAELVLIAQKSMVNLQPVFKAVDPEHEGMVMLTSVLLSAIGADGVLTKLEKNFLSDALGLNEESIQQLLTVYSNSMAEMVDTFVDRAPTAVKADVLTLVTCVAAVDEKISHQETAFIKKLLT